jgi:hypothetical protein
MPGPRLVRLSGYGQNQQIRPFQVRQVDQAGLFVSRHCDRLPGSGQAIQTAGHVKAVDGAANRTIPAIEMPYTVWPSSSTVAWRNVIALVQKLCAASNGGLIALVTVK